MEIVTPQERAQGGVLPQAPTLRWLILGVLALMAVVSTFVAAKEAIYGGVVPAGMDFQWSGAHLLAHHEDPWKIYITHQDFGKIILGQQPNYLAEFFLLLGPLGRMTFQHALECWLVLNFLFTIGILSIARRMFCLDRDHTLLVTFLLLSSTPFRVTIFTGQHGLFILLMLSIAFYARNWIAQGLALGVSFSKYSFSPLMVMVLLVKARISVLLVSVIPPLVGLLVAWHMLGGNLQTLAFEPIATSKIAMGPGSGDIMTPLEIFLRNHGVAAGPTYTIPAIFGLLVAIGVAIWIGRSKQMDERIQFTVALVMTLLCFKHVLYDFVVLVIPAAAAVMAPRSKARTTVLCGVGFFWFMTSAVNRIFPERVYAPEVMLYSLILLAMGVATSRLFAARSEQANPALAQSTSTQVPV